MRAGYMASRTECGHVKNYIDVVLEFRNKLYIDKCPNRDYIRIRTQRRLKKQLESG